jgi:hypothetical protein
MGTLVLLQERYRGLAQTVVLRRLSLIMLRGWPQAALGLQKH